MRTQCRLTSPWLNYCSEITASVRNIFIWAYPIVLPCYTVYRYASRTHAGLMHFFSLFILILQSVHLSRSSTRISSGLHACIVRQGGKTMQSSSNNWSGVSRLVVCCWYDKVKSKKDWQRQSGGERPGYGESRKPEYYISLLKLYRICSSQLQVVVHRNIIRSFKW